MGVVVGFLVAALDIGILYLFVRKIFWSSEQTVSTFGWFLVAFAKAPLVLGCFWMAAKVVPVSGAQLFFGGCIALLGSVFFIAKKELLQFP